MPAEPTNAKLKRRSSRKDIDEHRFEAPHSREIELKRNRGEISCAECRRLKIKCDKQVPCQSCQRRGCASLCPNGSLATGQGTRFVLAATEHLHKKIARYGIRIRELEDALATLQAKHSDELHPLLREDLMDLSKDQSEDNPSIKEEPNLPAGTGDVIDAFGTLSISDHGISRFFGPTGGSESLLISNLNVLDSEHSSPTQAHSTSSSGSARRSKSPSAILFQDSLFSQSFPFTPLGQTAEMQSTIEKHLPDRDRAITLLNVYYDQVYWVFRVVTREQIFADMLPVIYANQGSAAGSPQTSRTEDYSGPHDLALLFLLFAIGALLENQPSGQSNGTYSNYPEPLSAEDEQTNQQAHSMAEHYYQIARAALCLQPVLEKPSLVTIQTLHLMSILNAMLGSDTISETNMELSWSLVTLAANLSQTIGLHRDSARWGLSPKQVQRRRLLFWDLFHADVWQSLNTGRPPSFSLDYVDCELPKPTSEEAQLEHETSRTASLNNMFFVLSAIRPISFLEVWGFKFTSEVVAEVAAKTLTAEAPSYAVIMELDKKVREFPAWSDEKFQQNHSAAAAGGSSSHAKMVLSFEKCIMDHVKETILLYIHRSFFAQAIIENPINPLKSTYSPSFLAAYRASTTILKSVREQFDTWPIAVARFWNMLTFAFSAAVVFGTVVTRGPRSPLANSAMVELEQACVLFSKASIYSLRAKKALPILTKLRSKARVALNAAQTEPVSENGGVLWNMKHEEDDDELAIFAGHTRFISAPQRYSPTQPSPSTSKIDKAPSPLTPSDMSMDHAPVTYSPEPSLALPQTQHLGQISLQQASPSQHISTHDFAPDRPPQGHIQPPQPPPMSSSGDWMFQQHPPVQQDAYYANASSSRAPYSNAYRPSHSSHMHQPSTSTPPPVPGWQPGSSSHMDMDPHYHHHSDSRSFQQPSHLGAHAHSSRHIPSAYAAAAAVHRQTHPRQTAPPQHLQPLSQHIQHSSTGGGSGAFDHAGLPAYVSPSDSHPHSDLADLGLAARDSRLDQRWTSFMHDSGLLDHDAAAAAAGAHPHSHNPAHFRDPNGYRA